MDFALDKWNLLDARALVDNLVAISSPEAKVLHIDICRGTGLASNHHDGTALSSVVNRSAPVRESDVRELNTACAGDIGVLPVLGDICVVYRLA